MMELLAYRWIGDERQKDQKCKVENEREYDNNLDNTNFRRIKV